MEDDSAVDKYYAQKELIYAAQAKCNNFYEKYCEAENEWKKACDDLYKLEQECKILSEKVFP